MWEVGWVTTNLPVEFKQLEPHNAPWWNTLLLHLGFIKHGDPTKRKCHEIIINGLPGFNVAVGILVIIIENNAKLPKITDQKSNFTKVSSQVRWLLVVLH